MKHNEDRFLMADLSAAFRRLCVETQGRLKIVPYGDQPPSGGCVLKRITVRAFGKRRSSRLQAAVC